MAATLARKLWTVDEYLRLFAKRVLREDERVELIKGEIIDMAAIGPRHMACVILLQEAFHDLLGKRVYVSTQNALKLPGDSVPQPDLALLERRENAYVDSLPTEQDVLLVVEVADSTLVGDRLEKVPLYAEAGIQEMWLVNLVEDVIEVYSAPVNGHYTATRIARRGESLSLPGGLPGAINIDSILT